MDKNAEEILVLGVIGIVVLPYVVGGAAVLIIYRVATGTASKDGIVPPLPDGLGEGLWNMFFATLFLPFVVLWFLLDSGIGVKKAVSKRRRRPWRKR